MAEDLKHKHCVPCEEGSKPLSEKEVESFLKKLSGWNNLKHKAIEKKFHFINFKYALSFVNEVGDIAEFEGHHPDINLHNWNKVTITLSTHAGKGLTENDFILAAKIEQIMADNA